MTTRDELDGRVLEWLSDVPSHAPPGTLDFVLSAVPETAQRPSMRTVVQRQLRGSTTTRPRPSLAGPLASAIVVVIVVTVGLFALSGPLGFGTASSSPSPTTSRTASSRPSSGRFDPDALPPAGAVVDEISVSAGPLGGGSGVVWGSTSAGSIVRIDVATGTVDRRFAFIGGGNAAPPLALQDGSIWGGSSTERALVEVDAATGERIRTIAIDAEPYAIGINGTVAWVTDFHAGQILRVDLATEEITARTPYPGAVSLALVDGVPWVLAYWNGTIARLNPETGAIEAQAPVGGRHSWLTVDGPLLWIWGNQGARLIRFDTTTSEVREAPSGVRGDAHGAAVLDGRAWVTLGKDGLAAIDRDTLEPTAWLTLPVAEVFEVAGVDGFLWVGTGGGKVYQIQPAPAP